MSNIKNLIATCDIREDFAGPGGWDEGARMLGSTANILGIEINEDAAATARAAGHTRITESILNVDPDLFLGITGYIASPPCQTFSTAGKGAGRAALQHLLAAAHHVADGMLPADAVAAVHSEALDERSVLVLEPLRVALHTRPAWVALEQVPGALPVFEVIAEILRENGYHARTGVLNSEEYGVPQTRRRAILVAVQDTLADEAPWPTKTHSKFHVRTPDRIDEGYPRWVTMAEALPWANADVIGFLRRADSDDVITVDGIEYRARDLRAADGPSFAISGKARSWTRFTMGDVVRTNGTIREDEQPAATITGSADNGNFRFVPEFNDQSGTAYDAEWPSKRPSTTVAGRGLVQNPGATANRFNGSTKSRNDGVKITVAEAGVLQSFPADYPWQGSMTSQFQRAGDAIPPLMAAAILQPLLALTGFLQVEAAA